MSKSTLKFKRYCQALLLVAAAWGSSSLYAQVITANNDSAGGIVGSQRSFDIRANDIAPLGTVYTLQASPPPLPQCANAQVSSVGMASFTMPTTPMAQCTVVSAACPAGIPPSSTACQISTLTATAIHNMGQTVTSTVTFIAQNDSFSVNAGLNQNVNTAANDTMPAGSGWFLMSSTCTPQPVMNANGMMVVTGPSPAGSSCTAIYKACKGGINLPLPSSDCTTATVSITSPLIQNTPTLTLSLNTDTISVSPGSQGSYNVLANDVVPQGAIISLGSGSTCVGAAVSNTGIASYTAPTAAGTSCTVVYQVCVPIAVAPGTVCRTSTLIVTAQTINPPTTVTLSLTTDTATLTTGQLGRTNVLRNDTYPAGSTTSLAPGSTCANASVNNLGNASYTAPAAGSTCTVVYQVCTPATSASPSICRTSTLIVTGTPAIPFTRRDVSNPKAGLVDTFNVAANDEPGANYFIGSSTCSNTSITPAGLVSYTAPSPAGATCVVIYLACPAGISPPSAFCASQKLDVTAR
jgi:hypothetical protein